MFSNDLAKFFFVASLSGCAPVLHVVDEEPIIFHVEPKAEVQENSRMEELHWWGYKITMGNINYTYDTRDHFCTLSLGEDAKIRDYNCNGTVETIIDDQGYYDCFHNDNDRCRLATRIFEKKKESLHVLDTHQRWLSHEWQDILEDYSD